MFGFFKKKKHPKGAADAAITTAVEVLKRQISVGSDRSSDTLEERLADRYSRGYIFGLADALIYAVRIHDEVEVMALLTVIHIKLLGKKLGTDFIAQSYHDQDDDVFGKGRDLGSKEVLDYFQDGKIVPMGLAEYLIDGEGI